MSRFLDWHDALVAVDLAELGLADDRVGRAAFRASFAVAERMSRFMDGDGYCKVGKERLSWECRLEVKAVGRAIARWEDAGLLFVIHSKGGRKTPNHTWATFPVEDGRRLFDGSVVPLAEAIKGGSYVPPFAPPEKGGSNGAKGSLQRAKRGTSTALKGGSYKPLEALEAAEGGEALAPKAALDSAGSSVSPPLGADLKCDGCGKTVEWEREGVDWIVDDDGNFCRECLQGRNGAGGSGQDAAETYRGLCQECGRADVRVSLLFGSKAAPRFNRLAGEHAFTAACDDCLAKPEDLPAMKDHDGEAVEPDIPFGDAA